MPIKHMGKSILGDLGFCFIPSKMGNNFFFQVEKIAKALSEGTVVNRIVSTSMCNTDTVVATNAEYAPQMMKYSQKLWDIFNPAMIYEKCEKGENLFFPTADFVLWDEYDDIIVTTFSREAPILAFESDTGKKALGTILRPSLMKYGDYLFSSLKKYLEGNINVTLVTCNHFEYSEGSIPSIVQNLADKHGMTCVIGEDSETNPECYHRGETGNHVVAMW